MASNTEYRISFIYHPSLDSVADELEAVMESCLATWRYHHPQFGAVGSCDLNHATFEVTFSLEALSLDSAIAQARAYEDDTWIGFRDLRIPIVGISVIPTALDD